MKYLIVLMILCWGHASIAARVNTTQGEGTTKTLPPPNESEILNSAKAIKLPKNLKVPDTWMPYLNPAFEEFWTEGNHRPDTGFVLFARNPNKENAKLWLIRMETKAKYLQSMFKHISDAQTELIREGIISDRYGSVTPAINGLPVKKKIKPASKDKLNELEVFFLFSSTCGYCESLSKKLISFKNIVPLQVDKTNPLKNFNLLPQSEYATEETMDAYIPSREVPVLVIHDPKERNVNILKGDQSSEEIILAMSTLISARGKK